MGSDEFLKTRCMPDIVQIRVGFNLLPIAVAFCNGPVQPGQGVFNLMLLGIDANHIVICLGVVGKYLGQF